MTTLAQKRAWARSKREQQRMAGICTSCGKDRAPRGQVCQPCREKATKRQAAKARREP